MKFQLFSKYSLLLVVATYVGGRHALRYQPGDNVTLPCSPTTMKTPGEVFTWMDVDDCILIYSIPGSNTKGKTFDALRHPKYDNIEVDNNYPSSVNLRIYSLSENNIGRYKCVLSTGSSPPDFEVNIGDHFHLKRPRRELSGTGPNNCSVSEPCAALRTMIVIGSLMLVLLLPTLISSKLYWRKQHKADLSTLRSLDRTRRSLAQLKTMDEYGETVVETRAENYTIFDPLEIPETDLVLEITLPGNGFVQYHTAVLKRVPVNQRVVVKTLSDESTLQMNRILRSEVQNILKLPKDDNVVELLGWCKTDPNYIVYEFLGEQNLSDHLKEGFSANKKHKYGNTDGQIFEITDQGDVDLLPIYALQIARGIQFLEKNSFLSPGLQAKKVLKDTSGRWKLYDFVSSANSEKWCDLIWKEDVPFQWLPPEYIFLGTLSAACDMWSFGVLLWEIFSYGDEPFFGQGRVDVEKKLREKETLPLSMPMNCPGAIWQLMITCWESSAEKRANIDDVISKLESICSDDKIYLEIE